MGSAIDGSRRRVGPRSATTGSAAPAAVGGGAAGAATGARSGDGSVRTGAAPTPEKVWAEAPAAQVRRPAARTGRRP